MLQTPTGVIFFAEIPNDDNNKPCVVSSCSISGYSLTRRPYTFMSIVDYFRPSSSGTTKLSSGLGSFIVASISSAVRGAEMERCS